MLETINKISSLNAPRELKKHLNEWTFDDGDWIYYIFYAKSNLLQYPTITIVGEGKILDDLLAQKWVIESVEAYKIFIRVLSITELYADRTVPHKIFYHLNCHIDQIVFKSSHGWYEDLVDFKLENKTKYLKKTKDWFKLKENNYENILENYINDGNGTNELSNYVILGMQKLLKEILIDFQGAFCPTADKKQQSNEEVLVFILKYCNLVRFEKTDDSVARELTSKLTTSHIPIKELIYLLHFEVDARENTYAATLLFQIMNSLVYSLFFELRKVYIIQYEKRLNELELNIVKEIAKAEVKSWEDILIIDMKQVLNNIFSPQSVFLISKKYYSIPLEALEYDKGVHLFLVVISNKMTYECIKSFYKTIEKQNNGRLKVTLILQKKDGWIRHIPVFSDFYNNYFRTVKLFHGVGLLLDFKKIELISEEKKQQYNLECISLIENTIKTIEQNIDENFNERQVMLYKFVLEQSLVLIIYKKLNFIPHIVELSYLWDLIQWCCPDIYIELKDISSVKRILFDKQCFVRRYPKQNDYILNATQEDIDEMKNLCATVYSFTKDLLIETSK